MLEGSGAAPFEALIRTDKAAAVDLRARHLTPVELVAATRHGVRGRLKQLSEGSWGRAEDTLWSRDASGLANDYQQLARELLTRVGEHEGRHQPEPAVGVTS
jgi:hypothetical protein